MKETSLHGEINRSFRFISITIESRKTFRESDKSRYLLFGLKVIRNAIVRPKNLIDLGKRVEWKRDRSGVHNLYY